MHIPWKKLDQIAKRRRVITVVAISASVLEVVLDQRNRRDDDGWTPNDRPEKQDPGGIEESCEAG